MESPKQTAMDSPKQKTMDFPKQTATASMPTKTTVEELVVDQVVVNDKLKVFVDLYSWFSGHLGEVYISLAESVGLREKTLKSMDMKRVRWTCVSLSKTLRLCLNYG